MYLNFYVCSRNVFLTVHMWRLKDSLSVSHTFPSSDSLSLVVHHCIKSSDFPVSTSHLTVKHWDYRCVLLWSLVLKHFPHWAISLPRIIILNVYTLIQCKHQWHLILLPFWYFLGLKKTSWILTCFTFSSKSASLWSEIICASRICSAVA